MSVPRKAYGWGHGLGAPPPKAGDAQRDCVEVGECRPRHRSTKDTRHWCKGKVGLPHIWEWLPWLRRYERTETGRRWGTYNRVTEEPVCFTCGKIDSRRRHYCRVCGEPWPKLLYERTGHGTWRWSDALPCGRCGAPYLVRHR